MVNLNNADRLGVCHLLHSTAGPHILFKNKGNAAVSALHVPTELPRQFQIELNFSFPNTISAYPNYISLFLPWSFQYFEFYSVLLFFFFSPHAFSDTSLHVSEWKLILLTVLQESYNLFTTSVEIIKTFFLREFCIKYANIFCMDNIIVTTRFNVQDRDLMSETSVKNVQRVQYDWNQQTVTRIHTKAIKELDSICFICITAFIL